jgi:hypothetical protein
MFIPKDSSRKATESKTKVDLQMFSFCVPFCLFFAVLLQDNGSAKYFQGTRTGINMGEKVAQVNISFPFLFLPPLPPKQQRNGHGVAFQR